MFSKSRYFAENDIETVVVHAGPNVQLSNSIDASSSRSASGSEPTPTVPPVILHTQFPDCASGSYQYPSSQDRQITFKKVTNGRKTILTPSFKHETEDERKFETCLEEHKIDYLNKAARAKRTGAILKYSYFIGMSIVIVITALITLLSTIAGLTSCEWLSYIIAAIAAISAILTASITLMKPSERAVVINQGATQLRILANDLTWLTFKNLSLSKKIHILIDIEEKANEAKTRIFDHDITNFAPPQQKSIVDDYKDDSVSSVSDKIKNYFRKDRVRDNIDHKEKIEISDDLSHSTATGSANITDMNMSIIHTDDEHKDLKE